MLSNLAVPKHYSLLTNTRYNKRIKAYKKITWKMFIFQIFDSTVIDLS